MIVAFLFRKMGRNKDLTDWKKGLIAFGGSKRHDEEEISEFAGVSHSTVKCFFRQWTEMPSTSNQRADCNRKKILIDGDRQRLSNQVLTNRYATRRQMLKHVNAGLHIPNSARTLRCDLHMDI